MRTVARVILVLVLSAMVAACANVATPSPSQSTAATATANPSGSKAVAVGQMQTDGGEQVTVTKVTPLAPGPYDRPAQGDAYVVVQLRMINRSSNNRDYNEEYFTLLTATGDTMYPTYASSYTANAQLNYGTLAPGGTLTGDLMFEVPTADHTATLQWTPHFYNASTYTWHLTY